MMVDTIHSIRVMIYTYCMTDALKSREPDTKNPESGRVVKRSASMSRAILVAYAGWMTILTISYFGLLQAHINVALPFVWLAIGVSGITAIIIGIVRYRPSAWLGWLALAAANLFFISGDTFFKVLHYLLGLSNPFPSFADILYLSTYPLFAIGTFIFIRRHSFAKSDRGAILDAATLTAGLALL